MPKSDKKPKVIKVNLPPAEQFKSLEERQAEEIAKLKSEFDKERVDVLNSVGFTPEDIRAYLGNKHATSKVIKIVRCFLQAKALLELKDIEDASHIAAILVAPMSAPEFEFPRGIGIDYVDTTVRIDGDVKTYE